MIEKIKNKAKRIIEYQKNGCKIADYSHLAQPLYVFNNSDKIRVNLLIGTIDIEKMYGGLTTAINFYKALLEKMECDGRIIVLEDAVTDKHLKNFKDFDFVDSSEDIEGYSICNLLVKNGARGEIAIRKNDVFVATYWTTYYNFKSVYSETKNNFGTAFPIIYLIQDFEPGFNAWSSEYFLTESTYKADKTIAVFNSKELSDFFGKQSYSFEKQMYFAPKMNQTLLKNVDKYKEMKRKKQLILYGRPNNQRNAFSLIIASLNHLFKNYDVSVDWEFLSIGAEHKDIDLHDNRKLEACGKLTLDQYSQVLAESSIGLSLMCSPHPSYPPLEMAASGLYTITNSFSCKNLEAFSKNVTSLDVVDISSVASEIFKGIQKIENGWQSTPVSSDYLDINGQFDEVTENLKTYLMWEIHG